jgi:hypothetical protein
MRYIPLAALALALTPGAVFAQTTAAAAPPAPAAAAADDQGPPRPTAAQMSAMRVSFEALKAIRAQARVAMLGSLSAQHRAALATIIGQLAISAAPDPAAAERQIDALLSRGEAQNILNVAAAERTSERSAMEAARAQFEASLSADQKAKFAERDQRMTAERAAHTPPAPDAGRELLHTLVQTGREHGGPEHGGPEGMPRP